MLLCTAFPDFFVWSELGISIFDFQIRVTATWGAYSWQKIATLSKKCRLVLA